MKTRKIISKLSLITSIILALLFTGITSCSGQKDNKEVLNAYQLRLSGHADSAKVLLLEITNKNPECAIAWFELCRTTQHIGMANPREIKENLNEALEYINLAVENDPKNAQYLSFKGEIQTLMFYMALKFQDKNASDYITNVEETYNSLFQLDNSYYEHKISLVEFFGGLPEEMGGNLDKAEKYAQELERDDFISGAKAREILMPQDADYEIYWEEIVTKMPQNADAHQALGRVYLFNDKFDKAKVEYETVIDMNPEKSVLYLDLGRYYIMMAMQNQASMDSIAPLAEEQFNKYINFTPEPLDPMKAWTYGTIAMIYRRTGNKELSMEFIDKAKNLDPFYSPAFGKPNLRLYNPPNEVIHIQSYYLSPF